MDVSLEPTDPARGATPEPPAVADPAPLGAAVARRVRGRDVVLMAFVVRGTGPLVAALRAHGAGRVLLLAGGDGTGDRPPDVEDLIVPVTARTMTEEVLALEDHADRMTAAHHAALDAWDPERRALVLATPLTVATHLGGRPVVGARRPEWADLEDKATCDEVLAAAGVATPPHEVVAPADAGEAARRLDRGAGVVVAAGGRNGGADGVRWVAPADAVEAAEHLATAFVGGRGPGLGRVRVAPFVEGTPCSIGALVTADGVAVLTPVENVTLRAGRELRYSGLATVFEPGCRPLMEAAARRVGEELRRRVGYRGGFAIDGLVTADGWVATELNTRLSGGFNTHPDVEAPLLPLVQAALVEGWDDEAFTAARIEAVYRPAAEAVRSVRMTRVVPALPAGGAATVPVVVEGRTARLATDDEVAHGRLMVGEAVTGGVVMARLTDVDRPFDLGPPAAPLAVALLDLAADLWAVPTAGLTAPGPG